jgi:RNA polymerase sigma-70 factor (ECF subfamily)
MTSITDARPGPLPHGPAEDRPRARGAGREEFVGELYRWHGLPLLRYATRLLGGDRHRAEDILQETAARAWRHAPALDGDARETRAWLFTVVRNLVVDHHRARRARPVDLGPPEDLERLEPAVRDGTDRALTSRVVGEALRCLSGRHREVIGLIYYLEYSVAQASEHLGVPPGTVKSRTHYAMRALRKALEERGVLGV